MLEWPDGRLLPTSLLLAVSYDHGGDARVARRPLATSLLLAVSYDAVMLEWPDGRLLLPCWRFLTMR